MRCYSCGKDYDSDAMTCPFCSKRNFVERIPGTEEEIKGEDLFVARKTRSFSMFINIADRFVNKVLHIEKIVIGVMILLMLVHLLAAPSIGLLIRFINKDRYLEEFSTLYEQENFSLLSDRMFSTGCIQREGYEQYTEMVVLYRDYMDFCSARMEYQTDVLDGTLEQWTVRNLTREMKDLFSDPTLDYSDIPTHSANDPYREQYRQDVLVFAYAVLHLTEEELAQFEIINSFYLEEMLEKAIEEMR